MQLNYPFWIVCQTQAGIPYALGVPGTGKTMIAKAAAALFGREFYQFLLSHCTPEDMLGLPMLGTIEIDGVEHEVTRYVPSEVLVRATHTKSFVLLDEANQCRPAVQAAAQERWFNNTPPNAMVAAIANPTEMATDGFDLSPPVINRLCILDWEHNHEAYRHGLRTGEFPEPDIPVLPPNWRDYCQKWHVMLDEFASAHPEYFDANQTFPRTEKQKSKPWPSPRSWYRLAINLGAAESVGATREVAQKIASGFVGEVYAKEFFIWLDTHTLPSPEEILNDPGCLDMPDRFDARMSIIKGVLAHTKNKISSSEDSAKVFEQGLDFCDFVYGVDPELASAIHGDFSALMPHGHVPKARKSSLNESIIASAF